MSSQPYARSRVWPAAAALAACLGMSGMPVFAGDGSGTDNPALLRGTYALDCAAGGPCIPSQAGWPTARAGVSTPPAASAAAPANCAALKAAGIASTQCATAPLALPAPVTTPTASPSPLPAAPREAAVPAPLPPPRAAAPQPQPLPAPAPDPVTTAAFGGIGSNWDDAITGDWSIAVNGSSTWDENGQRYAITVSPQGELTVHRVRGEMRLSGGLGLAYEPGGNVAIESGTGAFEIDQSLTRDLMLRTAFDIDASRDSVYGITSPSGVLQGALSLLGSADIALDYTAGRAGFLIGGTVARQYVGDTMLSDGTLQANPARNWSGFGLRVRAGYELTPIISAFVSASADRAVYDGVNTGLGARADNWSYRWTGGLEAKWSNGTEASLYGGYGLTEYDSALVASGAGYVIGGSLTVPVLKGGEISAEAETAFSPNGSVAGATTEIAYSATLSGRYLVNDWLTLRGALGGSYTVFPGATYAETTLSAGAGLDWSLGPHTALTADYSYGLTRTPTDEGQSHTVSLGMTLRR